MCVFQRLLNKIKGKSREGEAGGLVRSPCHSHSNNFSNKTVHGGCISKKRMKQNLCKFLTIFFKIVVVSCVVLLSI